MSTKQPKISIVNIGQGTIHSLTDNIINVIKKSDVILYDESLKFDVTKFAREDAIIKFVGRCVGFHSNPPKKIFDKIIEYTIRYKNVILLKKWNASLSQYKHREIEYAKRNGIQTEVIQGIFDKKTKSNKIFLSYSKKDDFFIKTFKKYIKCLEREGSIKIWDKKNILPGEDWNAKTIEELELADIILIFASENYIADDYIWNIELGKIMLLYESQKSKVIPIILKPCNWQETPFGKLQALPYNCNPISILKNEAEAWQEIVGGIKKVA